MSRLLYVSADPRGENKSLSQAVGINFINSYRKAHPQDTIEHIDLYRTDIPLIDADILDAWDALQSGTSFNDLAPNVGEKVAKHGKYVDQFLAANKCVISSPLWNWGVPPLLKAWIDTIVIAGKTFKYTEKGITGLIQGRKILHIQASGGVYSTAPMDQFEFADRYLKNVFQMLGAEDYRSIIVEGANMPNTKREDLLQKGIQSAKEVALTF